MSAQDVIACAEVTRLHDLKNQVAALKNENAALRSERDTLKAHFALALLATEDLKTEPLEIWDGWNLILGAARTAKDRDELIAQAETQSATDGTRVWIVFDGRDERVRTSGRVRVSYTGGEGVHRADRFITDFVRMAAYLGLADRITVRTRDKDFRKQVLRFGAKA